MACSITLCMQRRDVTTTVCKVWSWWPYTQIRDKKMPVLDQMPGAVRDEVWLTHAFSLTHLLKFESGVWKHQTMLYMHFPVTYMCVTHCCWSTQLHRVNQFIEIGKLLSELMKSDFLLIHLLHPFAFSCRNKATLSQAPYNHVLFNYFLLPPYPPSLMQGTCWSPDRLVLRGSLLTACCLGRRRATQNNNYFLTLTGEWMWVLLFQ